MLLAPTDQHSIVVYQVSKVDDSFLATSAHTDAPLKPERYSEFKYGSLAAAKEYALLLAEVIQPHLTSIVRNGENIVIAGTPFKHLPNAAQVLASNVEQLLHHADLPTSFAMIYQHRLTDGDYSEFGEADRVRANRQKTYKLDSWKFEGKHVVIIDDACITGGIQNTIEALLKYIPMLSLTIVNLVRLNPYQAKRHPGMESELNHATVKNVYDIWRLMREPSGFVLMSRIVKYVLSSDQTRLPDFLSALSNEELAELHHGMIGDGFHEMKLYQKSAKILGAAHASRFASLALPVN